MMNRTSHLGRACALALLGLSASLCAFAQVSVLTRGYDNQRTGTNSAEPVLTAANVNASQFGKLFQLQVDDQVYAGML